MVDKLAYDGAWSLPDAKAMKAAGYTGAIRYLSTDASKNLDGVSAITPYHSTGELAALRAAGLDVCVVWETTANRAASGYDAGIADAKEANRQADALGYPKGCAIYYAVDYDATVEAVTPYFRGVKAVVGRPIGAYAGGAVLEALVRAGLIRFAWQTMSSGFRGSHNPDGSYRITPSAHLVQRVSATRHVRGDYDENAVIKDDYGQWRIAPPATATTTLKEDEMYVRDIDGKVAAKNTIYRVCGDSLLNCDNPKHLQQLTGSKDVNDRSMVRPVPGDNPIWKLRVVA